MNENTVDGQATTATEQAQQQAEQTQPTEQTLTLTQRNLDDMMARTRGATEREMLKALGIDSKNAPPPGLASLEHPKQMCYNTHVERSYRHEI